MRPIVRHLSAAVVAATIVVAAAHPATAQATAPAVSVTDLMSAEEIDATGVRTLDAGQLDALSRWLDAYRCAVARLAREWTEEGDGVSEQVIESRIDGVFDGWVGDTVFRLQNGQIWQQTNPSARYLFAQAPKVVITRAPQASYRMRVEGLPVEISVRRLR